MATIAEMFVEIGADASDFDRETRDMQKQMRGMQNDMKDMADGMGTSSRQMGRDWQYMSNEMKSAFKQSQAALMPFKKAQKEVEYEFFNMAKGMNHYRGTNKQFMGEVVELGKKHKKATDNMIKNNDFMKMKFVQSVGTMVARSGQSEKIAANFDRMKNPLYQVNNGMLKVTQRLEGIARAGQPAVLALKMLGPTANMKELQDMTMMIQRGLMRMTSVALAAAVASGVVYTALYKAAKGPNPADVYAAQAEAMAEYSKAVEDRAQEIMDTWSILEEATLNHTSGAKLMSNLQGQVDIMKTWRSDLAEISARAGEDFMIFLSEMGPSAAGEVAKIADMTDPELERYVSLWKEKMALSRGAAETEMVQLKRATERQVQALQETLTPLGLALEPMKKAWAGAFEPMVQAFTIVMVPIVNFITKIGEMITKFNEAHPTIALVVQGILMLVPILTLLLSPLAIGIGLWAGMQAALGAVWMIIGPLITGLAAMMGTVLLVAAAVVGFGVALWALWTRVEGFREGVIGAWNAIKQAAMTAFQNILTFIQPAIEAVRAFMLEKLTQIKTYWAENGAQIMAAASNVWNVIKTVIQTVMTVIGAIMQAIWPVIKALIVSTWQAIQNTISGAINVILGIISFFSALFTGNWKGVWEATKQILLGAVQLIWGLINLWFVGKFIGGFKMFASAAKAVFTSFWSAAKALFLSALNAIKSRVTTSFNAIRTVIQTVFNAIRSTITSILSGIKNTFVSAWNYLKSTTASATSAIKSKVKSGFEAAKSVVSSVMKAMGRVIDTTWNAIRNFVQNGVKNVKNTIKSGLEAALNFVKGLGTSFKNAGKGLIDMMASGIGAAAEKVIGKVKELAGKIRNFLPFSPAKDGPLDDLDHLDFGGPIADSLISAMPTVQRLMGKLLSMPDIQPPETSNFTTHSLSQNRQPVHFTIELDGRKIARGTLPHMEKEIRLKTGVRQR